MFPSTVTEQRSSTEATSTRKKPSSVTGNNEENDTPPDTSLLPPAPNYLSGFSLFIVITSVILVIWLLFLDGSIIVTAIPSITDEFHSIQDIGWYGSAYQVTNAALQPLTGKIYRYFSSKWCFFAFLVLFEIGSLICGAAPSSMVLILGRVVTGTGSSGLLTGGLTIIAGSVPLEKRPGTSIFMIHWKRFRPSPRGSYNSVQFLEMGRDQTNQRRVPKVFYINLPLGGLVLIFVAWCNIPDQVPKPNPMEVIPKLHIYLDFVGFLLSAAAAVMFLTALELGGNQYSFSNPIVMGIFCGSAVALCAFLVWNYRMGDDGLIPPSMAGKRPVWCAAATIFTFIGSAMVHVYLLPLYFQAILGRSPAQSGIDILPGVVSQLAFAYGGGILVGKTGYYLPWAVGGTAVMVIASGLLTTLTTTTPVAQWIGYQILVGAGRGVVLQLPSIATQANLPPEQISMGLSFVTFSQFMGSAVALAIGNVVFISALKQDLPRYSPNVNVTAVLEAGATAFRKVVSEDELPGVLRAFVSSIDKEFYFALGLAVACFCFSWGIGWKDVRSKKPVQPDSGP
ncbi:efflux pump mlcE [Colletotrichum spaethianum]|uniref:Efflux pump mlcE n=1 Tax=Colletotrichum spaethianum TaxID=700344 RepID=A0AA37P5F6_9PEZI|nr:efflux pump mlcE [Colletotrichum spaethianum]GKT43641.1 efflux pump mlcE [Colletotrichum spaethianum]